MNKVVIMFLVLFSGCSSVSRVYVPSDCDIIPETKRAVTVVCPNEIAITRSKR